MKWYIFNESMKRLACNGRILILLSVIAVASATNAQKRQPADTLSAEAYRMQESKEHEQYVKRYRERWEAFIPSHLKVQYAGNMGLFSIGTGWDYGKQNRWETDVLFGYLPAHDSKRSKITFTLKQNYIPWNFPLGESDFSLEPLTCGLYMNTVFGDEFWTEEPDRYPKGYYGFSSRVRLHIFAGQRFSLHTNRRHHSIAKKVTLFYELSTCDLYIISAFNNSYLRPRDFISLSFGLKLQLL